MSLKNDLEALGFDDKKAKIYLALLELGTAKAKEIAKKAAVERPTTYDLLAKLSAEGLVSSHEKKGIRYYAAENPEKIRSHAKEMEEKANRIMPELRSLYGTSSTKPRIRYYEGVEGIKTIFEDTLTSKNKELRGILSMADLYAIPGREFMERYVKERIEKGYSLRVVRSRQKETKQEDWPTSRAENRQLRYTPPEMLFSMTTYIYDNKVALISTGKENFGMIIESKEYHQTMSNLFEALWQVSLPS